MNRLRLSTTMFGRAFGAAAIVLFCLALARPALAQTVTAADILTPPEVEIINPDLYLFTVD